MKAKEAKRLSEEVAAATKGGGDPPNELIAQLVCGLAVNVARLADALERMADRNA